MPYSSFRVSHHKIKCVVYILLLLISKWKSETGKIYNKSSYPVTSFTVPTPQTQIKYHVIVSFRGADIREGFLSHLIEAFSQQHIVVFVDYNIPKGDEISDALLRAIEESLISLIIFSKNYASSQWCLLELVKILECRKKDGQTVLPIFYKVDPSDVRHQKGTYGDAFAEHERKYSFITTRSWRSALNESANIAGFHSSTFRNEAELVKDIVKCVLMRLNHTASYDVEDNLVHPNQFRLTYNSSNKKTVKTLRSVKQDKLVDTSNKTPRGHPLIQKKQKIEFTSSDVSERTPRTKAGVGNTVLQERLTDIYTKKGFLPWLIRMKKGNLLGAMKPMSRPRRYSLEQIAKFI